MPRGTASEERLLLDPAVFGLMYDALSSVALSLLSVSFNAGVRTAYMSRGKVVEDRPVEANELRLAARLGEDERFGRVGVYHFDYSSLTDRCEPRIPHQREFRLVRDAAAVRSRQCGRARTVSQAELPRPYGLFDGCYRRILRVF